MALHPRLVSAACAAVLGAAVLLVAPTAVAVPATPSDTASDSRRLAADVQELRVRVDGLEVTAEVAVEAYNEVRAELEDLIEQEVRAQGALTDAGARLDSDRGEAQRRVRALYRSGGRTEIAWTAWRSGDLGSVLTTYRSIGAVLDADAAAIASARRVADEAVITSAEVQELRRSRATVQAEADRRRDGAEQALRDTEALLASADSALVDALEAERLAAERAELARAMAAAEQAAREREAAEQAAREREAVEAQDPLPGRTGWSGQVTGARVQVDADTQALLRRAAERAPTAAAAAALQHAASRLGLPYTWGATGPDTFDCSGLTQWAYRQAGVGIPRTSRQQFAGLRQVTLAELAPGDLIFRAHGTDPGSIHHVAMYLGDGLMITAPRTGDVVKVAAVGNAPVYGAVRPVD